ncbi:MAG: class I SAM-dependent methyltransferase [Myxococcales bacterium]|nr:class I SAM-dependent methyltransferase [Myxococcales bacterium]
MSAAPPPYDGHDLEALADLPRYTGWILDEFDPWLHGRVIEVGAGIGNVALRYLDRAGPRPVTDAVLVEPAANLYARLQQRVGSDRRVQTVCATLDGLPAELAAPPFDAAVLVNVLEHIEDDLGTLRRLHGLLRPGGAVCLFVPAGPWLFGSLDRAVHHVRRYRRRELEGVVRAAGFDVAKLAWFDALGMVPWFVAGRVLRRRQFDRGAAALYDKVGVPLTRAVEARLRLPVGKSLVAVGVRG